MFTCSYWKRRAHTRTESQKKPSRSKIAGCSCLHLMKSHHHSQPKSPCPVAALWRNHGGFTSVPPPPPTCGSTCRENNRLLRLPIGPLTTALTHQTQPQPALAHGAGVQPARCWKTNTASALFTEELLSLHSIAQEEARLCSLTVIERAAQCDAVIQPCF